MAPKVESGALLIAPPKLEEAHIKIVGTAPYMQCRFSEKAMAAMMAAMDGSIKKGTKRVREARNYDEDYHGAMHISEEGWIGIPASSIRAALVSACRLVGFKMTLAKLSLFVEADGKDVVDGQPLIRIYGEPEQTKMPVRIAMGTFDIRIRPMWRVWHANLRIKFDADQFAFQDVINLLDRVGQQVGLGEGRPDSRNSTGMGYGTFGLEELNHVASSRK